MNKLLSRKFLVTLAFTLLVASRDAIGLKVSDDDLMALAGVVVTYIAAQGWFDVADVKRKKDA